MQESAGGVIEECRKRGLPIVVDADGLFLLQTKPGLVKGYPLAVLTPNVMEFARLCQSQSIDPKAGDPTKVCEKLAKSLGGVTIIQKGPKDYISNGERTMVCDITGGLKRSGGQGDTLTGCLVTLLAWRQAYKDRLWDHEGDLSDEDLTALSAYGAAAITRVCSRRAYEKKGRALQAFDLSVEVPAAFSELF